MDQFHHFPSYTTWERRADALVHVLGVTAGVVAVVWLLTTVAGRVTSDVMISLSVYGAGLMGMLTASAAYNLAPVGRGKERLRRIDHAMIYVMIAGSYTPFLLGRLKGAIGLLLFAAVWSAASSGSGLKLAFPRRFERAGFALYLGLGWAALPVIGPLSESLSAEAFNLLLAGGVLYTVGAGVHLMTNVRFHNAVWHALVVVAAGCHFAAIVTEFVPG